MPVHALIPHLCCTSRCVTTHAGERLSSPYLSPLSPLSLLPREVHQFSASPARLLPARRPSWPSSPVRTTAVTQAEAPAPARPSSAPGAAALSPSTRTSSRAPVTSSRRPSSPNERSIKRTPCRASTNSRRSSNSSRSNSNSNSNRCSHHYHLSDLSRINSPRSSNPPAPISLLSRHPFSRPSSCCRPVTGWWHHLSCDGLRCISLRICMLCICLCFRGRVCGHARHAVERCRAAVATVC